MAQDKRGNFVYPGIGKQLHSEATPKFASQQNRNRSVPKIGKPYAQVHAPTPAHNYPDPKVVTTKHPFILDWINLDEEEQSNSSAAIPKREYKPHDNEQRKPPRLREIVPNLASHPNAFLDLYSKANFNMSEAYEIRDSSSIELGGQLTDQPDDWYNTQDLDGQLAGSDLAKLSIEDDLNQLDEPIMQTLIRDLYGIYSKMKIIALPLSSYDIYKIVLRGWDLWGPLLLCTFLAFSLHDSKSSNDHSGPQFADVFVLVWFGSCLISLNYRLLTISSLNNVSSVQNETLQSETGDTLATQAPSSLIGFDRSNQNQYLSKDKTGGRIARILMPPIDSTFKTLLMPPSIFQLMCVFGYCLVAPCIGVLLLKILSFNQLMFERVIIGLLLGFAWPTICANRILIRYQHPDKRLLAAYPIGLFFFILSCMIILNH